MKTMKQCAQLALDVQDACNLSGVVRSFAEITEVLWTEARAQSQGTDWVNTHPVAVLFADKIQSLTHASDTLAYSRAYDECCKLVEADNG